MEAIKKSIFDKSFKPMYQGLLVFGIYIILLCFILLFKNINWIRFDSMDYWKYSTSMILFYVMICCVFCFSAKEKMIYYRDSIFTYIILIAILSGVSQWLSHVSLFEAESYSWILTVFSIIFIVMLTIINLVRKIVEIAIKQDKKLTNEK